MQSNFDKKKYKLTWQKAKREADKQAEIDNPSESCLRDGCNKPVPNLNNQKFCSPDCRRYTNNKIHRKNRPKVFITCKNPDCWISWHKTTTRKYCCDTCNKIVNKDVQTEYHKKYQAKLRAEIEANREDLVCKLDGCNVSFKPVRKQKFCKRQHAIDHNNNKSKLETASRVRTKYCELESCKKPFETSRDDKLFCHPDCTKKDYHARKAEEKSKNKVKTQNVIVKKVKKITVPKAKTTKTIRKTNSPKKKKTADVYSPVGTERKSKVVMALSKDILNDPIFDGIPTIDGLPKRVRKDRPSKSVAPRDGVYGDGMEDAIAEFIKNKGVATT